MGADILERSLQEPFIAKVNPTYGTLAQQVISGMIRMDWLNKVRNQYPDEVL